MKACVLFTRFYVYCCDSFVCFLDSIVGFTILVSSLCTRTGLLQVASKRNARVHILDKLSLNGNSSRKLSRNATEFAHQKPSPRSRPRCLVSWAESRTGNVAPIKGQAGTQNVMHASRADSRRALDIGRASGVQS